jgi:hypothetical protein
MYRKRGERGEAERVPKPKLGNRTRGTGLNTFSYLLQSLGNRMDTLDHVPDTGACCVSSAAHVHMLLQSPTCSTHFPSTMDNHHLECQRKLKATLFILTMIKPVPHPKPDILPLLLMDQGRSTPHAQFLAIESSTHEPPYPDQGGERVSKMYLRGMREGKCIW